MMAPPWDQSIDAVTVLNDSESYGASVVGQTVCLQGGTWRHNCCGTQKFDVTIKVDALDILNDSEIAVGGAWLARSSGRGRAERYYICAIVNKDRFEELLDL